MKSFACAVLVFLSFGIFTSPTHAQARYTASRKGQIQAGAGAMYLNNDYRDRANYGIAAWADYDFSRLLGAELEAHFGGIVSPDDIGENSYQIGPRITYRKRDYTVYGKIMFGRATISNQLFQTSSTYNIYSFGGGLEYRVARNFNLRVPDVEIQKWGDFEPHTLSPLSIVVGVSYIIR